MHLGRWLPQKQSCPKTGDLRPRAFWGDCVEPLLPTCPAPTWPQISPVPPHTGTGQEVGSGQEGQRFAQAESLRPCPSSAQPWPSLSLRSALGFTSWSPQRRSRFWTNPLS